MLQIWPVSLSEMSQWTIMLEVSVFFVVVFVVMFFKKNNLKKKIGLYTICSNIFLKLFI